MKVITAIVAGVLLYLMFLWIAHRYGILVLVGAILLALAVQAALGETVSSIFFSGHQAR